MDVASHGPSGGIHDRRFDHRGLGRHRPDISIQRYLAVSYQHRHDYRDIPDGFFDSEYPEP